jgi:hypothetical protein
MWQFRRRMKGIAMLDRYGRRRCWKSTGPALLAIALAFAAFGNAIAAEDEEDVPMDTRFIRGFMNTLGFQRDGTGIEYHERAPLVVPPSRDLPPPESEGVAKRSPAWPKDPDVARRKQATAAEKAKLYADYASESARPLRPDQLNVPGGTVTASGQPGQPAKSAEESMRPMSNEELGTNTQTLWQKMWGYVGPARPESVPFSGEPPRTSMTAPPTGYQTPSAAQPYGIDPTRAAPQKPATLEQRLEPAR